MDSLVTNARKTGRTQEVPRGQKSQQNKGTVVPPYRRVGEPNVGYTVLQDCQLEIHNLELKTTSSLGVGGVLRRKERSGSWKMS